MHTPFPDIIIFGEGPLPRPSLATDVHAFLADPLAPLLAKLGLRPEPADAPRAGERSYLCVWRQIGCLLFLEQVLRPDLSGGEVVFGRDDSARPPAAEELFEATEAELARIRAWLSGKRRRWNGAGLLLPATWVRDPISLVFACKGAELSVERADLRKPDPLYVWDGSADQYIHRARHFPSGGEYSYHCDALSVRERIRAFDQDVRACIADAALAFIRTRFWRWLGEEKARVPK